VSAASTTGRASTSTLGSGPAADRRGRFGSARAACGASSKPAARRPTRTYGDSGTRVMCVTLCAKRSLGCSAPREDVATVLCLPSRDPMAAEEPAEKLIAATRNRLPSDAPSAATLDELAEAERQLGFPLPQLLCRMYTEVANGLWGPEYGANGLLGGARVALDQGLVEWYRTMRGGGPDSEDTAWPGWPHGLVAVCSWGCAIWSCVDCNSPEGRVIRFDPNEFGPGLRPGPGPGLSNARRWRRSFRTG
jgi:hypothetical protein